jgi:hypothetical protein
MLMWDGGLQNDLPPGRSDVVFWADDLNLDLGRSFCWLAKNPPWSSREFLGIEPLGSIVGRKEPQRIVSVDPSINKVSRGGVDPILFVFFLLHLWWSKN